MAAEARRGRREADPLLLTVGRTERPGGAHQAEHSGSVVRSRDRLGEGSHEQFGARVEIEFEIPSGQQTRQVGAVTGNDGHPRDPGQLGQACVVGTEAERAAGRRSSPAQRCAAIRSSSLSISRSSSLRLSARASWLQRRAAASSVETCTVGVERLDSRALQRARVGQQVLVHRDKAEVRGRHWPRDCLDHPTSASRLDPLYQPLDPLPRWGPIEILWAAVGEPTPEVTMTNTAECHTSVMNADITETDERHLQRCVELATLALDAGDDPFGSVLADSDGVALAEAVNREVDGSGSDGASRARTRALGDREPDPGTTRRHDGLHLGRALRDVCGRARLGGTRPGDRGRLGDAARPVAGVVGVAGRARGRDPHGGGRARGHHRQRGARVRAADAGAARSGAAATLAVPTVRGAPRYHARTQPRRLTDPETLG